MFRLSSQLLIFLSGVPYFSVGFLLIKKGLFFSAEAARIATFLPSSSLPIAYLLQRIGLEEGGIALLLTSFALALGLFKGRAVIVPQVERNLSRLAALKEGATFSHLYDGRGWKILFGMMGLGFLLSALPLPADLRGLIDLTVGVGLLQGGIATLRTFKSLKKV